MDALYDYFAIPGRNGSGPGNEGSPAHGLTFLLQVQGFGLVENYLSCILAR